MKIAIIGNGKMGQQIQKIAVERGHEIHALIDDKDWSFDIISGSDVAIEFTQPASAKKNIINCFKANVPVVIGTTGWYSDYDEVVDECKNLEGALLASTNFSLGVNIFFEINKKLATLMNLNANYKPTITETHHIQKLDKPSGTAISLAEQIIEKHESFKDWNLSNDLITNDSISIESNRETNVPGKHTVLYENDIDEISITHSAKNRKGFAIGAVLAAEFIANKKGIFTMKEVLGIQ